MIDVRKWIKSSLETVCSNVALSPPVGVIEPPLITYSQVTDTPISRMYDDLQYQIDVYASSFSDALELVKKADALMTKLGFARTYQSPDSAAYVGTDLYHIALNYQATVNREWMAIISSQKTQ